MWLQKKVIHLVAICVVAALTALSVCRHEMVFDMIKSIPILGWLIAYNFPPSDYYVPCATFPISETCHTRQITFRYKGRYDVHIHNISTLQDDRCDILLSIRLCTESGEEVLSAKKSASTALAYYNRSGEVGYRYFFMEIDAPDDVPMNANLSMTVSAVGDVNGFLVRNPKAQIEVVKCFDK